MTISVITCTWNSISTVKETVESVQAQRGAEYELIFVDGGSTDGTLEYIRGLPNSPRILEGVSGGIAKAMNAGAQVARGEYLCHLHSDDYFLHARVLQRVDAHFRRSGVEWLFGRILYNHDGALVPEQFLVPKYSFKQLVRRNIVPHPASFVRRTTFLELGGFRTDLRFAMDYEFFLRLAQRSDPLALTEALSVFRVHAGSTTVKNQLASFEEDHAVRLDFVGRSWAERLMHAMRYSVRRRRLLAQLARG